jgi:hypothetical protein
MVTTATTSDSSPSNAHPNLILAIPATPLSLFWGKSTRRMGHFHFHPITHYRIT